MKPTKDSNPTRYNRIQAELCTSPKCDEPITDGRVGKCQKCRDEYLAIVSNAREESKKVGLCPRCPTVKRNPWRKVKKNPLRFGLDRCLDCLFADHDCRTCGRPFAVASPWCGDHDWLQDFPALIEELRKVRAEHFPKYMKSFRTVRAWKERTRIKDDDLPPHWKKLVGRC